MLRLFARRSARRSECDAPLEAALNSGRADVEQLEARRLFAAAPYVTSITSDNRGEVVLNTDRSLNPESVHTRSVLLFSVGPDGEALTADDIKWPIRPIYTESNRQLRIRTTGLEANTTYFVKLSAKQIYAWDGMRLDGEFNGAGVRTGNGAAYGDLLFVSRRDKGPAPVARFYTRYGGVNVSMFKSATPNTFANFVSYANKSAWDGTFIHRSVPGFITQGGGFIVTRENEIDQAVQDAPVVNEPGISNTRGTIAMAKLSDNPNSATNQWFFNVADNSQNLDAQNGGFTAFGEVVGGMDIVDFIAGRPRVNAGGAFSELPLNDLDTFTARGNVLDPAADVVSIHRVAMLNKISPLIVP
ncbi:MAG TPA: peptidylprolyl isomerase [Tepidisphaeraceae bacterium]|nr:peptidylprolyl isomerase [Tepidisphaeraceae bacterium]